MAFCGDTIFALGCGRVFEGTMEQMWTSLEKIAKLPKDTTLYCGHEYTQANADFAMTIEPDNAALQARVEEVKALRAKGQPTLPTTVEKELATNPFLRAADPGIQAHLGQLILMGQGKAGKQGLGDSGHEGVLLLWLHDS